MNSGQGHDQGHGLFWTGPDARTGIYGSRLGRGALKYPALLQDIDRPGDHEDSND